MATTIAPVQQDHISTCILIDLELDSTTYYISTAYNPVTYNSNTYTELGSFLQISELNEGHRMATLSCGKYHNNLKTEMQKHPLDRIEPRLALKMYKDEYDRLIEVSPEILKKILKYNINQDVELFKKIKSNHSRIISNSLEPDKLFKDPKPIFIVGMPRSGTTLVEQIISSHSKVTGAGELSFAPKFGAAIAKGSSELNYEAVQNFRARYLTKLMSVSKGNSIVTDKMPQNFLYLGLIASAFPEAKIVHVKRNSAAVCWSNYKQYFFSKYIGYCYAIDDVLSYYKMYENLMEFWENSLSKIIYNLDYERLIANQESETRQLINYLGLDWDEKCLSPQDNMRSVETASNLQVRKKVYQGSSQEWKRYEPFLNGRLDGLK